MTRSEIFNQTSPPSIHRPSWRMETVQRGNNVGNATAITLWITVRRVIHLKLPGELEKNPPVYLNNLIIACQAYSYESLFLPWARSVLIGDIKWRNFSHHLMCGLHERLRIHLMYSSQFYRLRCYGSDVRTQTRMSWPVLWWSQIFGLSLSLPDHFVLLAYSISRKFSSFNSFYIEVRMPLES